MNDRELLELAARAAGIVGEWVDYYGSGDYYYKGNTEGVFYCGDGGVSLVWNPLTDDGDALRLAASLGIHIAFYGDHIAVQQTKTKLITAQARDGDMFAATRRAIVRAAAEIGAQMTN